MKAILVFEVNEFTYEAIKEWFAGVITLHLGNDGFIDFEGVDLKPLPQKKNIDLAEWCDYGGGWNCGWNACIDEILGGTSNDN